MLSCVELRRVASSLGGRRKELKGKKTEAYLFMMDDHFSYIVAGSLTDPCALSYCFAVLRRQSTRAIRYLVT